MYKSPGPQLFRTTTGIQSGPNAFDESMFIMTPLIILGVTEILCCFRLVLEGKIGKEMPKSSRLEWNYVFIQIMFSFKHWEMELLLKQLKHWKKKFLEIKTNLLCDTSFCILFFILIHSVFSVRYWESCKRIDKSSLILVIIYRWLLPHLISK